MEIIVKNSNGGAGRFHIPPKAQLPEKKEVLEVIKKYIKTCKKLTLRFSIDDEPSSLEEIEKTLTSSDNRLELVKRSFVHECFNKKYIHTFFKDGMYGSRLILVNFRPLKESAKESDKVKYDDILREAFPQNIPSEFGVGNDAIFYDARNGGGTFYKKCGLMRSEPLCLQMLGAYNQLKLREMIKATTLEEVRHRIDKDVLMILRNVAITQMAIDKSDRILSVWGTIKHKTGLGIPVHIFTALAEKKEVSK